MDEKTASNLMLEKNTLVQQNTMSGEKVNSQGPDITWKTFKMTRPVKITATVVILVVIITIISISITLALTQSSNEDSDRKKKPAISTPKNRPSYLLIGAFNIRTFGQSKMSKRDVADHIKHILSRYDIVLVQEVRDSTGKALRQLWSSLNETDDWGLVQSERLGRSSYQEQYVFFHKLSKSELTGTYQHNDMPGDLYAREPFCAEFKYTSTTSGRKKNIVLLALHATPSDVSSELSGLPSVMKSVSKHFSNSVAVIAMGDFNADCSYLNAKQRAALTVFKSDMGFESLIHDSVDTTVASTDCAYDRIVVYKTGIVDVRDAKPFEFDKFLGLNESQAMEVSDHYPVEFQLF